MCKNGFLNFGNAIVFLKAGKKLARKGWYRHPETREGETLALSVVFETKGRELPPPVQLELQFKE